MDPVREHLLAARRAWVERVVDCADAVAEAWGEPTISERERVVPPFRAALDRSGALAAAPRVLAECVEADGGRLRAEPVAGPPYVVVTGEGLLVRGTLDARRLVVRVRAFVVERDPVRYRRREGPLDALVEVERVAAVG